MNRLGVGRAQIERRGVSFALHARDPSEDALDLTLEEKTDQVNVMRRQVQQRAAAATALCFPFRQITGIGGEHRSSAQDLSDSGSLDLSFEVDDERMKAVIEAGHSSAATLIPGVEQASRVGEIAGDGLLNVRVLARGQCSSRGFCVQPAGKADHDGIDIIASDQITPVGAAKS